MFVENMYLGESMMQKSAVMTSRRSASAAYDIQLINQHLVTVSFKLMMARDACGLSLIISQKGLVRQVTFEDSEVGDDVQSFLAIQDPVSVAARVVSSADTKELDMDKFFLAIVQNLHRVYRLGVLDDQTLTHHLEEVIQWRENCDPQACIAYLHQENLGDVADDSKVYRTKPEEVAFWQTIWKSMVSKSSVMSHIQK